MFVPLSVFDIRTENWNYPFHCFMSFFFILNSLFFFRNSVTSNECIWCVWYHFCPFDELNHEKFILKLRVRSGLVIFIPFTTMCVCVAPVGNNRTIVYIYCARSYLTWITNSFIVELALLPLSLGPCIHVLINAGKFFFSFLFWLFYFHFV